MWLGQVLTEESGYSSRPLNTRASLAFTTKKKNHLDSQLKMSLLCVLTSAQNELSVENMIFQNSLVLFHHTESWNPQRWCGDTEQCNFYVVTQRA